MEHKPGCTAEKDLYFCLIARNSHGPDMELLTEAHRIKLDRSLTQDGYETEIKFNYCPLCGIKYEDYEK